MSETTAVLIRMPAAVKKSLAARAETNFRTLNGEILKLIQDAMKADEPTTAN